MESLWTSQATTAADLNRLGHLEKKNTVGYLHMLAKTSFEHEWKDILSEVESYEKRAVAHETRKALPAVKNVPRRYHGAHALWAAVAHNVYIM